MKVMNNNLAQNAETPSGVSARTNAYKKKE